MSSLHLLINTVCDILCCIGEEAPHQVAAGAAHSAILTRGGQVRLKREHIVLTAWYGNAFCITGPL